MSYSRWCDSRWYTFWCSGDSKAKESQLFAICPYHVFSYQELTDDLEGCLDTVCEFESTPRDETVCDLGAEGVEIGNPATYVTIVTHVPANPVSASERDELRGYMKMFLSEMDGMVTSEWD